MKKGCPVGVGYGEEEGSLGPRAQRKDNQGGRKQVGGGAREKNIC